MRKAQYIGDCVFNPFSTLTKLNKIISQAREISKETFLKNVNIEGFTLYGVPLKRMMKDYPNDFTYYSYKGKIYFFTHSKTEHFFR